MGKGSIDLNPLITGLKFKLVVCGGPPKSNPFLESHSLDNPLPVSFMVQGSTLDIPS